MSTEQSRTFAGGNPTPMAEATAAAYIAEQLPKARQTLKRTRMVGVILVLVVGAYISVISVMSINLFQPKAAAEVASGMLSEHLAHNGPALVGHVEKEIPALIHGLPDYLIQQVPLYREQIEHTLVSELEAHCTALGKEVGAHMDALIELHKPEMKGLMEHTDDRAALRKIIPDFEQIVSDFLAKAPEGISARAHIEDLAAELQEIDERINRLANGQELSPEELKARHSLALLARAIKNNPEDRQSGRAGVKKLVRK